MRLANKIAIVTGAGSGFGRGIATRFAAEGARVVVNDIHEAPGRETVDAIGAAARFCAGNVAADDDVKRLVDFALTTFGGLTTVVNNAGTTHRNQPLLEVTEAEFDRIYAVNVKSLFLTARHAVPHFRKQGGGAFITIASTAGVRPRPGLTWYNASKAAVNLVSKSMAAELAPDGIRVNAICPVMGATGLIEEFLGAPDTPENRARIIATIPLGRMSTPEDVANAALYLASDAARFITGIELPVDGGRTI